MEDNYTPTLTKKDKFQLLADFVDRVVDMEVVWDEDKKEFTQVVYHLKRKEMTK